MTYAASIATENDRCAMRDYILSQAEFRDSTYAFPVLRRIVANWRKRRQLKALEQLEDHMLMDIGLTRADLIYAQRLPLDVDPVSQLMGWPRPARSKGLRHK